MVKMNRKGREGRQGNEIEIKMKINLLAMLEMIAILLSASACQVYGTLVDTPAPTGISTQIILEKPAVTSILAPGDFDYFILALSWSPDYCSANSSDAQQCAVGRKLGFVLHGLWPEYSQGYPSSCSNQTLPAGVKAQFPGLFPNDALYTHEWETHGTCSGLSPFLYFTLAKQIKDSIRIPADFQAPQAPFRTGTNQMKQQFAGTNPGLGGSSMAVFCSGSGRFLSALYVCFSKKGEPTACSAEVQKDASKSCQNADFLVRNIR